MYTIGDVYFLLRRELHYWFCCISWSLWAARTWRALSMLLFCRSISSFCLLIEDRSSSSVSLRSRSTLSRLSLDRFGAESSSLRILKIKIYRVSSKYFVSSIQNIRSFKMQAYWMSCWRRATSLLYSSIIRLLCSHWTQKTKPSGNFRQAV